MLCDLPTDEAILPSIEPCVSMVITEDDGCEALELCEGTFVRTGLSN